MYIKRLIYKNVGPVENIDIEFSFDADTTPKPIIFVGENGTGKSTLLSNIVDSFYEIANKAYDNATMSDGGKGYQYYKAIVPIEIHNNHNYMYSYVEYFDDENFAYVSKCGDIDIGSLKTNIATDEIEKLEISEPGPNFKTCTTINKEKATKIWDNNVITYFGPDRYEKPVWMGNKYYENHEFYHPVIKNLWSGKLYNSISAKSITDENIQWLLDIILDSRADIGGYIPDLTIEHIDTPVLLAMRNARENLELLMSKIIGEDVYFGVNFRNSGQSRLRIIRKNDNNVLVKSLDSLSTGQIALFNMFATIIRYADSNNLFGSINLSRISGIVVIDEVELHLHTKLQRDVLPELIKLFPKVQFIVTTHAPLFVLGMEQHFGSDNYDIYEMPTATKISAERFSEFQKAYDYFKETKTYQREAEIAVSEANTTTKTLIITEGTTDWIHMKTAFQVLSSQENYKDIFDGLEFDFLEYEPMSSVDADIKIEMGNTTLTDICENYAKIPQDKNYIFIADRDVEKTNKKLCGKEGDYRKWSNNVYSFILPVPPHRSETPNICIEHLYTDDEIKTEVMCNDVKRRLYLGGEFDNRGIATSIDKYCERANICGPGSINIIEGSQGDKVTSIEFDGVDNYALSKMNFAKYVSEHREQFNFDSFIEIFKIIKSIISEYNNSNK